MKTLSLYKFDQYLKSKEIKEIAFDDGNNTEPNGRRCMTDIPVDPMRISLRFTNILVTEHPAIRSISLLCDSGCIVLSRVEKIKLYPDSCCLEDKVVIYCKLSGDKVITYTLLVKTK